MANNKIQILKALEDQAARWIVLGIAAVIFYPIIFLNWTLLHKLHIIIPLMALGLSATMVWWFWTMKIVTTLLKLQRDESMSLDEILKEVKAIRQEVQKEIRDSIEK